MRPPREKHRIVTFARVYEIPESKIIERMTEVGSFTGRPEEDEMKMDEQAQQIASDLIGEEMAENTDDVDNFFSVEVSPSVVIY